MSIMPWTQGRVPAYTCWRVFRSFPRTRESRATVRRAGKAKRARVLCGGHGAVRLCPPYAIRSACAGMSGIDVQWGLTGGAAVKFGLMTQLQIPKPWEPQAELTAYRNTIEQAVAGEAAGFHYYW